MKNTEAIKWLKEAQSHIDLEMGGNTQEMYDALELAIKALEFTDDFFHESFNSYLNGVFGNYVEGDAE